MKIRRMSRIGKQHVGGENATNLGLGFIIILLFNMVLPSFENVIPYRFCSLLAGKLMFILDLFQLLLFFLFQSKCIYMEAQTCSYSNI